MKRRKFLLGVGSAAAAGSALIGSGAFSQVEAQRSVTIQIAEDPNAYLGLDKCQIGGGETPNSSYAHLDDLGHLKVFMDDENPTIGDSPLGDGVNSDSSTWFDNVFQICNQGKEDVCVWIEDSEDWPVVPEGETDAGERRVEFYLGDSRGSSLIGEDNSILLPLGECICVGIRTRTYGLSDGDELLEALDNEIRIVADVDGDCASEVVCGVRGAFNCIQANAAGDGVGSHGIHLENVGETDIFQDVQYVLLDSPDQDDAADDLDPLPPDGTNFEAGESAFPVAGVVAYVPPEGCDVTVGQPRDEWTGIDGAQTLILPEDSDGTVRYDLIEGLTQSRYNTINSISSYSDLVSAFDDDTSDPDPEVPADAYLTQVDYSGYDLSVINTDDISQDGEGEFEQRILDSDIPQCGD